MVTEWPWVRAPRRGATRRGMDQMDDKKATWEDASVKWSLQAEDRDNRFTRLLYFLTDRIVEHVPSGKLLDFGCGPGLLCSLLADRGFDVYGTDIAERMIEAAMQRMAGKVDDPGSRFHVCRDGEVPFDGEQFDLVIASQVLGYVADQPACVERFRSLLKPGGLCVASVTNRFSLYAIREMLDRSFRFPPHVRTIFNLARTGWHSAGHVPRGQGRQVHSARRFDGLFRSMGFEHLDSLDWFHFHTLDGNPLARKPMGRFLARRLGWHHYGVFRKTG